MPTIVGTGIPSQQTFGAGILAGSIVGIGIPTAEAFGVGIVAGSIVGVGIASSETFGTGVFAGPLIGVGIASEETSGSGSMLYPLTGVSITSNEAFGIGSFSFKLLGQGIASTASFGAGALGGPQTIFGVGIPSAEVISNGVFSSESTNTLIGSTGTSAGGTFITILSPGIEMDEAQDTFGDGIVDPGLWSQITVGSGYIVEIPDRPDDTDAMGGLQLSSGRGVGGQAVLRGITTHGRFDAEATFHFGLSEVARGSPGSISTWLGAYVSGITYLRAYVEVTRATRKLRVTGIDGGIILFDSYVILDSRIVNAAPTLRLLRAKDLVLIFMNGALVFERRWTSQSSSVEFGVMNDTIAGSIMTMSVSNYIRRPVIMFGDVPMTQFRFIGKGRVDGIVPAGDAVGLVTLHIEDFNREYDLNESFIYTPAVEFRAVGTGVNGSLVVVSDEAIRAR